MRKIKIVADSSCDKFSLEHTEFACAPMKIITADREFVDDRALDVNEMVAYLDSYKGRSKSSCPNVNDWLEAFGDADDVFCVTITSGLSGSFNSARLAKEEYESKIPEMASAALVDGCTATNPRIPTKDEVIAIYKKLW